MRVIIPYYSDPNPDEVRTHNRPDNAMTPPTPDDVRYVDNPNALSALCQALEPATVLSLDTEFMREKTYRARLCLIQIATDDVIACVDPIALPDLDPLMAILYDPKRLKVLHAARQDLEIFHDLHGRVPAPVFDTQIAAALLGFSDQAGYGTLVEGLLGITLEKGHARTDWSRRPLDAEQIAYAADDVRHLHRLYPLICERLEQAGRSDWLDDDFRALTDPDRYRRPDTEAWRRVSGHGRLKPQQLAILQTLAAWREAQARERDKPRKWILGDEVLLDLARRAPTERSALERIRGLNPATLRHHGETLLALIEQARQRPKAQWPTPPARERPTPEQEGLADLLMACVRILGQQHGISPATLTTRKEVERLVRGERDLPLLQGWRARLVGDTLLALLQGRLALQVRNDRVVTVPANDEGPA